MACNSSFRAQTSTNPQRLTEEICATSLINGLQFPHDPNSSTDSPSFTHPEPSESEAALDTCGELPKLCGFLTLARELRDLIYSDLITSCDLAILRVSYQVHDEAKKLLYNQGICRLHLYFTIPFSGLKILSPRTPPPRDKIQNFNIVMSVPLCCDRRFGLLTTFVKSNTGFARSVQGSGECHITLIFYCLDPRHELTELFDFIKHLNTFKLVSLRMHLSTIFHPMDRRNRSILEPVHTKMLQSAAESLLVALGYSEWKTDTCPSSRYQMSTYAKTQSCMSPFPNAQYLEFHPCEK